MNNEITQGNWKQVKGKIREQWGEITEDELEKTKGNIDQIAGSIQKLYGESLEEANKKLNTLLGKVNKSVS